MKLVPRLQTATAEVSEVSFRELCKRCLWTLDDDELEVSTSADKGAFFLHNTSSVFTRHPVAIPPYPNQQLCFAYLSDNNGIQTDIWGESDVFTFPGTFLPEISPFLSSVYEVTLIPHFCLTGQADLTRFTAFIYLRLRCLAV